MAEEKKVNDIKLVVQEGVPPLKADVYPIIYLRTANFDKGKFGPCLKHDFAYKDGDREINLNMLSTAEISPYNKTGKIVEWLLGRKIKVGEEVNLISLEGKEVKAFLKPDAKGFMQIENFA